MRASSAPTLMQLSDEWRPLPEREGFWWWRRLGAPVESSEVVGVIVYQDGGVVFRRLGQPWRPVISGESGEFAGPIGLPGLYLS